MWPCLTSLCSSPHCGPRQQKDNLARIRDNQRRSRARRREYLQELEQRLRVYELQGIEASTEVQMAARRVAEENRQLRELLNRHGVADNHIALFLQSGLVVSPDAGPVQPFRPAADPGSSAQALQHLLVPRPVAGLDPALAAPSLPGQSSREPSSTSGSTNSSSIWSPSQPSMSSYGHQQQHVNVVMGPSAPHNAYQPPASSFAGAQRQDAIFTEPSSSMLTEAMATTQTGPMTSRPAPEMHYPLPPYPDPSGQHYGVPGDGC
ncbi:hypothetical protein CDD80_6751 [Ophiocordyceps camponoti-rufipedis]|uniref:BZIP domain-containing protein n=1 Tax=Ophiocordyceps camponoti-rufipedis TaxID=2004952 RepID=A0A2C5YQ11_9HYPO|nr:hypothetical protein CDD80_6751 [Ophiocordyceps camponoti-rufipedis]